VELFRKDDYTGADLADLVAEDGHGMSVEQKVSFVGIKSQAQIVALARALEAEPSLQPK
jgi:hypothetical protein